MGFGFIKLTHINSANNGWGFAPSLTPRALPGGASPFQPPGLRQEGQAPSLTRGYRPTVPTWAFAPSSLGAIALRYLPRDIPSVYPECTFQSGELIVSSLTPVASPGWGIAPFQPGLTPYGTYQGICFAYPECTSCLDFSFSVNAFSGER